MDDDLDAWRDDAYRQIDLIISRFNDGQLPEAADRFGLLLDAIAARCDAQAANRIEDVLADCCNVLDGANLELFQQLLDRAFELRTGLDPDVEQAEEDGDAQGSARAFALAGDDEAGCRLLEQEIRALWESGEALAELGAEVEMIIDTVGEARARNYRPFLSRIRAELADRGVGITAERLPAARGKQTSAFCPTCEEQRAALRTPTSHGLHLAITVITGGLWAPVWYVQANRSSAQTFYCTVCGTAVAENR